MFDREIDKFESALIGSRLKEGFFSKITDEQILPDTDASRKRKKYRDFSSVDCTNAACQSCQTSTEPSMRHPRRIFPFPFADEITRANHFASREQAHPSAPQNRFHYTRARDLTVVHESPDEISVGRSRDPQVRDPWTCGHIVIDWWLSLQEYDGTNETTYLTTTSKVKMHWK